MLEPGAMNRRITFQTRTTALDDYGQPTDTWTDTYTAWASINVQQSALIYETSTFVSQAVYRIETRWTSSVVLSAANRIVWTERSTGITHTYEIKTIINEKQQNNCLVILCYEIAGAA